MYNTKEGTENVRRKMEFDCPTTQPLHTPASNIIKTMVFIWSCWKEHEYTYIWVLTDD